MIPLGAWPTINACLNATSALLLVSGLVAIRKGRVAVHRASMLAAFAASILFLLGYLYYHWHHGSTRFSGEGWIRPVYFTLLATHTTLAALVPPLAVLTLYRALRSQFERHRRIARWTWPIWMYVSVTGVLVYLVLYVLYPSAEAASSRAGP